MIHYYIERLMTWTEGPQRCVFHPGGMLRIDDDRSINIIQSLEPLSGQCIEEPSLLDAIQDNDPSTTIPDLIELKLIRPLHELFSTWNQFDVYTDRPDMLSHLVQHLETMRNRKVNVMDTGECRATGDVAIVYLDAYHKDFMEKLWLPRQPGYRLIQCCYRLDRFLYLDNPYIYELQNATHWANLKNIINKCSQVSRNNGDYFSLFTCRKDGPDTAPAVPLNTMERRHVEYLIHRRLEKLMGLTLQNFAVDEINISLCRDLTTDKLYESIITDYEKSEPKP